MKKITIISALLVIGLSTAAFAQQTTLIKTTTTHQIGNIMICPVSDNAFSLNKNTPKLKIEDKTYYFCCKKCVEKFKKEFQGKDLPNTDLDIANEVICPVMETKFVPNSKSPKIEYKGKTYYFCCSECVEKFNKEPEKYTNKSIKSVEKHKKGKTCCKKCS